MKWQSHFSKHFYVSWPGAMHSICIRCLPPVRLAKSILETTEPHQKSNQTPVIKMLMFICSSLSKQQLCLCACMCLNLYAFATAVCSRSPRDSSCVDEWKAFVELVQCKEWGVKVHYVCIERDGVVCSINHLLSQMSSCILCTEENLHWCGRMQAFSLFLILLLLSLYLL